MGPQHRLKEIQDSHELLENAHRGFVRLHSQYKCQISKVWHSFDRNERARFFLDHFKDEPLRHHLANHNKEWRLQALPELNLHDVSTNPEFLLELFKHRATKSLFEQYSTGLDGQPGDGAFVIEKVKNKQIKLKETLPDLYTIFEESWYGDDIEMKPSQKESLDSLEPLIEAGLCVPHSIGTQIYSRQFMIMTYFRIMILSLLKKSPRSWWTEKQWRKIEQETASCETYNPFYEQPEKPSTPDLLPGAQDLKEYLEESLAIFWDEPDVLVHEVKNWLNSRPELVMDDKGRPLSLPTDKHERISGAIFEVVRSAIERFTIWSYICSLLELLDDANTVHRRTILQELSNISQLEYSRAQAHFTRHVQTGIGARCFRRVANAYDEAGNPKVKMKIKPEELAGDDVHLQYVLRICQSNTSEAMDWIQKLDKLYESHPCVREELLQREIDALAELIVAATFIRGLSAIASMPAFSRKVGQAFFAGSRELHSSLNDVRKEIDLQDFSVSMDQLLKPGMARKALIRIDAFVVRKTGAKLEFSYQYIAQECLAGLQKHDHKTEETLEESEQVPHPVTMAYFIAEELERRRYGVNKKLLRMPMPEKRPAFEVHDGRMQNFVYAGPWAKKVCTTLFGDSKAKVSISWTAFQSTMASMGFCINKVSCSIYTFSPPKDMILKTGITVCQPRGSKIEGHLLLILSRQLRRAYGAFINLN